MQNLTPVEIKTDDELAARLQSRLVVNQETGCHEWTGSQSSTGYGKIKNNKRRMTTHRVAYAVANGHRLPGGIQVRHKCGNRLCCNPEHLEAFQPNLTRETVSVT